MSDTNHPSLTVIDGGRGTADAIRMHVRKTLEASRAYTDVADAKIREIEEAGGRIVSGGSLGDDEWDITDWRTGKRLAYGDDGMEGYDQAAERLDPDGKWWHIDRIHSDLPMWRVDPTDGVPPSLATLLEEWAVGAPADEVAIIAGMSEDEVLYAQE